jgi:hypothetical protein
VSLQTAAAASSGPVLAARVEVYFLKAYVMTTGTVFGLIVVAHIWRAVAEGLSIAENPLYILLTAAAAALALWAYWVFKSMPRP